MTLTLHNCFHNYLLSEAGELIFLTLVSLMGALLQEQLNCECLILGEVALSMAALMPGPTNIHKARGFKPYK